jgi:hypothetical protein
LLRIQDLFIVGYLLCNDEQRDVGIPPLRDAQGPAQIRTDVMLLVDDDDNGHGH